MSVSRTTSRTTTRTAKGSNLPRIAISPGEPAGIGPDVCLLSHEQTIRIAEPVYFGDIRLFEARAKALKLNTRFNVLDASPVDSGTGLNNQDSDRHDSSNSSTANNTTFNIHQVDLCTDVTAGVLDVRNAPYVLAVLKQALTSCTTHRSQALVTGPINKAVINDAGIPFTGHTEWLAAQTGTPRVVMMLAAGTLRVALATTHLALREVPDAINAVMLEDVIRITFADLKTKFAITSPHLLVCGLNPHAGENGHLGREEIDIISPVVNSLKAKGFNITGPVPADTAFTPRSLKNVDAVLAMFHDQGLPPLKYAGFGEAINITLGLPIIRTSVDHGTALDLAGSGNVDAGSMLAATTLASELARAAHAL